LIRQLLTENLLLSIAGAAVGLAIAFWATQLLMAVQLPTPVPVALDLSIDVRVLAFTTGAAVAATLAFGAMPAFRASRIDLVQALKGFSGDGPRHSRLRAAFLVAQVSMSVLLLITAGLRPEPSPRAVDRYRIRCRPHPHRVNRLETRG
jgi:putative ABC transport system permease protein